MAADGPPQPGPKSIHHLIYSTALGLASPASTQLRSEGKRLGQRPALAEFKK